MIIFIKLFPREDKLLLHKAQSVVKQTIRTGFYSLQRIFSDFQLPNNDFINHLCTYHKNSVYLIRTYVFRKVLYYYYQVYFSLLVKYSSTIGRNLSNNIKYIYFQCAFDNLFPNPISGSEDQSDVFKLVQLRESTDSKASQRFHRSKLAFWPYKSDIS